MFLSELTLTPEQTAKLQASFSKLFYDKMSVHNIKSLIDFYYEGGGSNAKSPELKEIRYKLLENTFRQTLMEGGNMTFTPFIKYLFLVMIELSNKPVKGDQDCYLQKVGMPFIKHTLDSEK
jgi:hypothetical protein